MYRLVVYETLINVNGGTLYFIGQLAGKTKNLLFHSLELHLLVLLGKVRKTEWIRREMKNEESVALYKRAAP
jgi:hypothetical protein